MRNAEKDAAEKAERRTRLLEAAFRLMSARSIEAVKLTEIAEAAGLGIVTLYRYFKTKPDLVIELGVVLWKKYYVEVEKAYAARGGAAMNAAEEMEFFLDSIIELYRSHKDVLKFNRNFDTYVKHEECTAEQMRPYNEAVEVFAHKFHVVYEKAMKDGTLDIRVSERRLFVGTLYAVLSVAGKFAEGLVYPSEDHDMIDELQMIKQMILGALVRGDAGRAELVSAARMADATSASLPVRRRPSQNSVITRPDNRSIILFVSVNANRRQCVFDNPAAVACILAAWKEERDWNVGRYVIMPDHIHFSCAPGNLTTPDFHEWMKRWKSRVARTFPVPHATPLWQRNCWDVQLRTGESYVEKCNYMCSNPVRKRLVTETSDWPYQGVLNVLEWHDK
ncbi:MAG: TetR family transcriptional regulator [Kiritimatiellae bacterium]|nr:TetR family transcriptional regulator [Kiritimatiellia bacterium]